MVVLERVCVEDREREREREREKETQFSSFFNVGAFSLGHKTNVLLLQYSECTHL